MPAEPSEAVGKGIDKKRELSSKRTYTMALFSATIFISAALLFLVEPMFAKFVLPTFGGTPAVWTGSMMFFQATLLVSYLYVHVTAEWLGARRQAAVHLVMALLPLLVLPIAVPAEEWAPPAQSNPLLWLLGLLLVTVGLPFFVISSTNPLIQRWLSETDHPAARDPYFLYRASNLGSVVGLLGYPLLMEPNLRLVNQGTFWSLGYALLVVLVFASAVVLWRSPTPTAAPSTTHEDESAAEGGSQEMIATSGDPLTTGLSSSPTLLGRLRWVGLAFVPSSFMLGVTAFITTDITPVPLLWVIPLSLYLFSFVVVFSRSQRVPGIVHKVMVVLLPVMMTLLAVTILSDLKRPYWALILLHLFGFFVVAMVLHGELARERPPARHLTEFYLWVAVGGVLGGVFNALVAPLVFDSVVEYPLTIVLACLLLPGTVLARLFGRRGEESSPPAVARRLSRLLDVALPLIFGVLAWGLLWAVESVDPSIVDPIKNLVVGLALVLLLHFAYANKRPIRFGLGIAALMVSVSLATTSTVLYEDRSFFGVYRVSDEEGIGLHEFKHGSTEHGAQLIGETPPEPIAYYDRTGPVGQLFDLLPEGDLKENSVAVLGLGTGGISCYAQPGQRMIFYEIDPLVERIARDPSLFTYLRDCPGEFDVVLGDARLSLANANDGEYGLIVGDVFSSDAIPVHLLTREAVDLYLRKLRAEGVLVMHISNRHLKLEPVVGDLARDRGLACYAQFDDNEKDVPYKFGGRWAVMAQEEADLGRIPEDERWLRCTTNPDSGGVWTDDFSNLLSTFEWN